MMARCMNPVQGIDAQDLRINWSDLMAFKRTFTDKTPDRVEGNLKKSGIKTYQGTARFVDHNTIDVEGSQLQGALY